MGCPTLHGNLKDGADVKVNHVSIKSRYPGLHIQIGGLKICDDDVSYGVLKYGLGIRHVYDTIAIGIAEHRD